MRRRRSGAGRWVGGARIAGGLLAVLAVAGCAGDGQPIETPAAVARPADPMSEARPAERLVRARPPPEPPNLAAVSATPRAAEIAPVRAVDPPQRRRFAGLATAPPPARLAYTPLVSWLFDGGLPADWRFGPGVGPLPVAALLTAPPGAATVVADGPPAPEDGLAVGLSTVVPAETVAAHGGQSIEITIRLADPPAATAQLAGAVGIDGGLRTPWRRLTRAPDGTESLLWTLPLTIDGGLVIALSPAAGQAAIAEVSLAVGTAAAP